MIQLALIVALLCVIPCFIGIAIIYMQVLGAKGAITQAELLCKAATEKAQSIEARFADIDLPNYGRIQALITEAASKADRAYLKAEGVMESHLALVNRINSRERDAEKKAKRAAKEAEQPEEVDELEPADLQYNLLSGGVDKMPVPAARPQQVKRRFGEPPKPHLKTGT